MQDVKKRPYTRRANTKLSEEDVAVIRQRVASKRTSQSDLAREFNVSRQYISLIIKGKSWKSKKNQ